MPLLLVVDDEPAIRALVRASLEPAGWRVIEALDGEEALVLASSERPDAVVLDMALPKTPGTDVCRQLRERPATSRIPILLLSGLPDRVAAATEVGASGFMSKPFNPSALLQQLEQALYSQPVSPSHAL